MQADTPLPEVASFLAQETAEKLLFEPFHVQQACLEAVRTAVVDLEEQGTLFDPFHLGAFIDGVVRGRLEKLGRT